ncbi:hypothetical protein MPSEU_000897400 [Mayamaea pseudoterrestris]|nr:hypothetical protein MPSEU_000897400 [Mayamaea pseudoterrestris]
MSNFAFVTTLLLAVSAQGFISPAVPTVASTMTSAKPIRLPIFASLNNMPTKKVETSASAAVQAVDKITTVVAKKESGSETQQLMRQVKDAGVAGVISYALWELGFWLASVPVVLFGYYELTGHMPDLANSDDMAKLGAEAFAFVNFARFAVPLRIGLALSTTSWIQANIVDRFMKTEGDTTTTSVVTPDGAIE